MGIAVWEDNVTEVGIWEDITQTWYEENSYIYWKNRTRVNFSYTWSEQTFTVPKDWIYKLEVWGAQWWSSSGRATYQWGCWWYACWELFLLAGTVLKIYVWQQWKDNTWGLTDVAFNWGWKWWYSNYNGSNDRNWWGWGWTDIRIWGNTLYHRLIVAWWWAGWHAYGDFSSLYWWWENWWEWWGWRWGTQTWWGSFWVWGSSSSNWEGNRWSMNWWWGWWYWWMWQVRSSSDTWYSDFVSWWWSWFVRKWQDTVPSGYLVPEDYILSETENIAWNQEMPTCDWTGVMTWNTWNGYAVISCLFFIPPKEKVTEAGIYHNPDLWLISMSADGENRVTIADKNAGAWSDDIEDELSYGWYFQFGNIHWFWVLPEPEPVPPEPEPTSWEFEYDFRNWSLSWFQSAWGWDIEDNWSHTFDADWLWQTNGSNDRQFTAYVPLPDLTNASIMEITSTWYYRNESWSNWKGLGFCSSYSQQTRTSYIKSAITFSNNSWYQWQGIDINWTVREETQQNLSTWDYTFYLKIDLINKVAILDVTWPSSLTKTTSLSDSEISMIMSAGYGLFFIGRGFSAYNNERLKTVNIKVTY